MSPPCLALGDRRGVGRARRVHPGALRSACWRGPAATAGSAPGHMPCATGRDRRQAGRLDLARRRRPAASRRAHPPGRARRHARPDGHGRPGRRRRQGHPAADPPRADRQGLSATIRLGQARPSTDDAEGEPGPAQPLRRRGSARPRPCGPDWLALTGASPPGAQRRFGDQGRRPAGLRAGSRRRGRSSCSPGPVTVTRFEALGFEFGPTSRCRSTSMSRVECSSGTYVRALARDLGAGPLGPGGHLTALAPTSRRAVHPRRAPRTLERAGRTGRSGDPAAGRGGAARDAGPHHRRRARPGSCPTGSARSTPLGLVSDLRRARRRRCASSRCCARTATGSTGAGFHPGRTVDLGPATLARSAAHWARGAYRFASPGSPAHVRARPATARRGDTVNDREPSRRARENACNRGGAPTAAPARTGADCVVTIGVFDGIHRGHAEIIARAVQAGRAPRVPERADQTFVAASVRGGPPPGSHPPVD